MSLKSRNFSAGRRLKAGKVPFNLFPDKCSSVRRVKRCHEAGMEPLQRCVARMATE